ncbi:MULTISPECIES: chromate transporter [unclassified Mycoplasma]|uniref:chromate transporter n=1 Tax=unclassified Mycoplasma TaxID=2683645 RepID=UPI00211C4463|nr:MULTISPECIES: chromate transporter [unclassified Mycoplasma]UUM19843.1 chromate transporter [Mycoplasma sp. 1578d]UUM24827.1 chromate transporter [Mycoplasma sp. 3686d]
MITASLIIVSLFLIAALSLTVFGGGALFMPVFEFLWKFLDSTFGTNFEDKINSFFAAANATPGILAPKFAVYTGYMLGGDDWLYIFIFIILSYFVFMFPAISLLLIFRKIIRKNKNKLFVKTFFNFMFPVLIGVMISLAISLFLKITFPFFKFNSSKAYISTVSTELPYGMICNSEKPDKELTPAMFFSGWRLILLIIYSTISITIFIILIKRGCPIIYLIFSNIIIGLIIFAPWLVHECPETLPTV